MYQENSSFRKSNQKWKWWLESMISFQIRLMGATSLLYTVKNHAELFQAELVEVSVAINPLTMIIYPNHTK